MKLPKINDTITTSQALALCQHYGYIHLTDRINRNKNAYKQWKFDGASMVPDRLAIAFFKLPNLIEISLKHDLKYAYGDPGNKAEKRRADLEFKQDLLNDGAIEALAQLIFTAVEIGGQEWLNLPFSWGFANKKDGS